jgi:predicted Zn-dependent protease
MKRIGICFIWFLLNGSAYREHPANPQAELFSEQELQSLANDQYQRILSTNRVLELSNKDAETVKKMAEKIVAAVKSYYTERKQSAALKSYTWEICLVNKKDINSFCLPGARTIIGTGMLDWAQNEGSLAVVYSHELAHLLLGHGAQRFNNALKELMGGKPLSELLSGPHSVDTRDIFMAAYGAGTNVGLLSPFNQDQEAEADKLAMIFAAMAGYNPRETIVFWERMGKLANGPRQPVLMSVHPAPAGRITKMQGILENLTRKYYRPIPG